MTQTKISFVVRGAPQGKGRPRFTRSGHAYTPKKTVEYENRIVASYLEKYKKLLPFQSSDEIVIQITAVFEPPASASQVRKERMLQGEFPTKKPDIDNICKAFMDAMNGVVYPDDKQVVAVVMKKVYGEHAHVRVDLESIEGGHRHGTIQNDINEFLDGREDR